MRPQSITASRRSTGIALCSELPASAMSFKGDSCSLAGHRDSRGPQAHESGPPPGSLARPAPPDTPPTFQPRPGARGPGRWRCGGRGPATEAALKTRARGKARPSGGADRRVEADPYLLQSGSHGVTIGPEAGVAPLHRS